MRSGGIVWATAVGLLAYKFGKAAADAVGHYGLFAVERAIVGRRNRLRRHPLWRKRVEGAYA